ncbi:hypothetical protein GGF37_000414 [Kickxella alabastrina]|nr:hypothetical protein GGF37_000414 [Kickxella alabastrina]
MLAAWATCCIFFGVSISLFGVDQGWITFVGKPKQDTLEANPNKESEQDNALTEDLESEIKAQITDMLLQTDVAKSCLESPDEWKRIPFFWSKDNSSKSSAFIPGTLHGPGKLSVEPIVFLNRDRKQFIVILHIGKRLCGHSGIVHGGVLATLFDDITARPAFWNLPRNIAFTASLKINYRRPVLADQVLVCKTQLAKLEGRKGSITAQLEDVKGNLLSDAEVLYVSPSNEKMLPDAASMIKLIESVYPGNF